MKNFMKDLFTTVVALILMFAGFGLLYGISKAIVVVFGSNLLVDAVVAFVVVFVVINAIDHQFKKSDAKKAAKHQSIFKF